MNKGELIAKIAEAGLSKKDAGISLDAAIAAIIQTVNAFKDIGAGLKTLIGGELTKYNEMMDKARKIATDRMIAEAEQMGADAIVCFRYSTSSIMQSAAEIMAYGTAVKFK